jgi:transposase
MIKKDARLLQPVIQQDVRNRAVEMFLSGYSQVNISTILGVSTRAIYNWLTAYKHSGHKGLKIRKRGRPEGIQLKPWQCAQIVGIIKNHCPDEVSLPFFCGLVHP